MFALKPCELRSNIKSVWEGASARVFSGAISGAMAKTHHLSLKVWPYGVWNIATKRYAFYSAFL